MLATPTTLIGMLRAVAYGWKQAALAESAAEVFKLGRDLHEKLGLMGNRFDKLGRALRTSVNAYNETIATVEGTVLVRARKFRDLKVSEKELAALSPVEEPVRQIQAVELVDDAVKVEPLVGRGSRRRAHAMPEAAELVPARAGPARAGREHRRPRSTKPGPRLLLTVGRGQRPAGQRRRRWPSTTAAAPASTAASPPRSGSSGRPPVAAILPAGCAGPADRAPARPVTTGRAPAGAWRSAPGEARAASRVQRHPSRRRSP